MKRRITLACLMCAAVPAWAADVGVGISAKSNDSTIYVPIDFGNAWRLEPFVNYAKTEQNYGAGIGSVDSRSLRIGTGVFALQPLGESLQLYFGGRLSYLDVESAQFSTIGGSITNKGDGYRIAPTLGFEYSFNKHVSLGGEAEWFYEDVELDNNNDRTSNGTDTRLILRFRF
jgi:hypothetical protein